MAALAIAGIVVLNNLTDTQKTALTPSNGMLIYNSTLSQLHVLQRVVAGAGIQQRRGQLVSGSGASSGGTGNNGDYYLNTANGAIYQKSGGKRWSVIWNSTVSRSPVAQ